MSQKKLMNDPSKVVDEALQGYVATHPDVSLLSEYRVVYRTDAPKIKDQQVAVMCGGGSGHEPAHIGYVGKGMLTAAICGDVFASPSARHVHEAIRLCGGKAGVLLVVKCYTGDRLHFTLAAERAKAEGIPVEVVVIGEDEAIPGHSKTLAGRRGLCGTILAYKIAGALAEQGASLSDIAAATRQAGSQMGSLNIGLGPCCAPGKQPGFSMPDTDMEMGLGIHGEAGYQRTPLVPANQIVARMLDLMLSTESDRSYLPLERGESVVLMVNNLGATTNIELSIMAAEALQNLDKRGISVQRVYVGTFMTALDMPGASLTLLRASIPTVSLLDAPTSAPAWPSHAAKYLPNLDKIKHQPKPTSSAGHQPSGPELTSFKKALLAACSAIDKAEPTLTAYDKIVGDGDCGTTLQEGAHAISTALESGNIDISSPHKGFRGISHVLEENIGGSSGALYCIGLEAAATAIQGQDPSDPKSWHKALDAGTKAIMQLGARKGDRTMLDSLIAACETLEGMQTVDMDGFMHAADSAMAAAEATANMTAGAGRSTYVNKDVYNGTPDPGAIAVAIWLKAAVEALK
eukprot:comp18761_c0_seq1/m.20627 comp18761_c0_seq1/g.20627  ORF comp18761_c0_seq1/g.20627 comp18761_c0_seq1/m.20627 type:complete len:575 (-) comp18761_c0_seq1:3-1727(-)